MERSEAYWILHGMWGEASEEQREALSIAQMDIEFVDLMDDRFKPVKHGRWEKQSGLYSCSVCGSTCPYDVQADVIEYWTCNYCPNCGAKMDLEEIE